MIDEITLMNTTTGRSVQLGKTAAYFILLDTDGINWGSVAAQHGTYTSLTEPGDTITSTTLKDRTISITGHIWSGHNTAYYKEQHGALTLEELYAYKKADIDKSKTFMSAIINPLNYLMIQHKNYYITGKPTSSIEFGQSYADNNEISCKYTFSIICPNPMFKESKAFTTTLAGTVAKFHFPLISPKGTGFLFGIRSKYRLVSIGNSSDTEVGGVLTLIATGKVINPLIINVDTQEQMLVHKTMMAGEIIKIDTVNRTITGSTDKMTWVSYFKFWEFDNSWIQFVQGSTLIGFTADEDSYQALDLEVELDQQYYSLEDE